MKVLQIFTIAELFFEKTFNFNDKMAFGNRQSLII